MSARPFVTLLVSPDRGLLRRMTKFLDVFGFDLRQATDPAGAITVAEAHSIDFLLVDAACDARGVAQLCRNVRRLATGPYLYALLLVKERELTALSESLEAGYDDFLMQPIVFGELLARLRAGSRVIEFERRLHEQAGIDSRTGLTDRLALLEQIQERLQAPGDTEHSLAVIDVDSYRRVARRQGEAAAEALHVAAAHYLRDRLNDDETLAVVHANRFALLRPTDSLEDAGARVRELVASLGAHEFAVAEHKLHLTASCGVTLLGDKERPEQTLERAGRALSLAKASGRNCVVTSDEVENEVEAWAESAAAGRLFETTLARDVMIPCPLVLPADEALDQAHGLLVQSQLTFAPVVDGDGNLLGIAQLDEIESKRPRGGKVRSSSVRLLRHVMSTDVPTFEETASLGHLMEFFTADGHELAIICREKLPLGIVTCQGLAALNERLAADRFVPCGAAATTSQYLVVPDLPSPDND